MYIVLFVARAPCAPQEGGVKALRLGQLQPGGSSGGGASGRSTLRSSRSGASSDRSDPGSDRSGSGTARSKRDSALDSARQVTKKNTPNALSP